MIYALKVIEGITAGQWAAKALLLSQLLCLIPDALSSFPVDVFVVVCVVRLQQQLLVKYV